MKKLIACLCLVCVLVSFPIYGYAEKNDNSSLFTAPTIAQVPLSMTVGDFFKEINSDPEAARQKYKDKEIIITECMPYNADGNQVSFGFNIYSGYDILTGTLSSEAEEYMNKNFILTTLSDEQLSKLSSLSEATVTLQGRIEDAASPDYPEISVTVMTVSDIAEDTENSSEMNEADKSEETVSEDAFLIEDFYLKNYPKYSFYHQFIKVRNNYGTDVDHAQLKFQVLDKNGDIIDTGTFYINELDNGQATSIQSQAKLGDGDLEKVSQIRFTGYSISEKTGDNTSRQIENVKYSQPLTFSVSSYIGTEEEEIKMVSNGQNGEIEDVEPEVNILKIGDTAKTDTVEFTLTSVTFGNKLSTDKDSTFWLPTTKNKALGAGEGNTFVVFDFTVQNLSKNAISGTDICGMDSKNHSQLFKVNYNDGYMYDWGNYADLSLALIGGVYNYNAKLDPLKTATYRANIKCINLVETDKDAPLLLEISLPTSTGRQAFKYTIR